jgi:hypothetical protein
MKKDKKSNPEQNKKEIKVEREQPLCNCSSGQPWDICPGQFPSAGRSYCG